MLSSHAVGPHGNVSPCPEGQEHSYRTSNSGKQAVRTGSYRGSRNVTEGEMVTAEGDASVGEGSNSGNV